MSDQQVQQTLNNMEKQERQLQPYYSRNPKRAQKNQNDMMNMLPREQQEMMKQFFGNNFPGAKKEDGGTDKDW